MIWANVSIAAVIESSPRIGMSFFIGAKPFGKAPAHMTKAQNAVPRAPRENIPRTYSRTNLLEIVTSDCVITIEATVRTATDI